MTCEPPLLSALWCLVRFCRGGGTVHPAIPDLRRTYGSVYARFDAGFTFRFRWVRVRFSWDPYRISTDFRIRTGFRTQVEWESPWRYLGLVLAVLKGPVPGHV